MSKWNKIVLLFALLLIVDIAMGQGCSQCRAIAEQSSGHGGSEQQSGFADNINLGILYLMAIPYLLLLFFFRKQIVGLFRALKRR